MEALIKRARNLLGFMSELEAADVLVGSGTSPDMAFLALRAAKVLGN